MGTVLHEVLGDRRMRVLMVALFLVGVFVPVIGHILDTILILRGEGRRKPLQGVRGGPVLPAALPNSANSTEHAAPHSA